MNYFGVCFYSSCGRVPSLPFSDVRADLVVRILYATDAADDVTVVVLRGCVLINYHKCSVFSMFIIEVP